MKTKQVLALSLALASITLSAHAKPLTIGVIADVNGSGCQTKYPSNSLKAFANLLGNHQLDQIIMTGDAVHGECMKYSGSIPYQNVVRNMWEEFDKNFFKLAHDQEGVDIILAPGNHDAPFLTSASRDTFRVENAEFVRFWQAQKPRLNVNMVQLQGLSDKYPYYWAYTLENVLFVVLQNTKVHSLADGVAQKKWLRALLDSPVAKGARARIAFGHVPPYPVLDPSVGNKYREILDQEQVGAAGGLVDLFLDHGLDLLLVGHSHAPYPGELTRARDKKKLKILSMPCGHAPRKLVSKTSLSPRGYAVLEVSDANQIMVSLRNYADNKPMPLDYFPASIPLNDPKVSYQRMKISRAKAKL